ncbi:MAG: hypothetical protein V1725_05875 [archaeon]
MKPSIVLLLLILVSCTAGISKEAAEQSALTFMQQQGKFYTNSTEQTLSDVTFSSVDSYVQDGKWHVAVHVAAVKEGKNVSNDVIVVIDSSGKVVSAQAARVS